MLQQAGESCMAPCTCQTECDRCVFDREKNFQDFQEKDIQNDFQMDAFRLDLELWNYENGIVNSQGIQEQLKHFLGEYLTRKMEFQYEYHFNNLGQLINPDWTSPAITIFQNATEEIGIDPHSREIRQAELQSFSHIEAIMRESVLKGFPVQAILQSPKENYSGSEHSFVALFKIVKEDGQYKVKVRNRRVYHCKNFDHLYARQEWLRLPGVREAVQTGISISDQIQATNIIQRKTSPVDLLGSAIIVSDDIDFDSLMNLYGDFQNLVQNDTDIQRQLEEFQAEIERFQQYMCSFRYEEIAQPGEKQEQLTRALKLFLIKARVHFDRAGAIKEWDQQIVDEIAKLSSVRNTETDLEERMLDLKILISGSCGKAGESSLETTIGASSISQIVNSLYKFVMPGEDSNPITRPDEVTCTECGCTWFVKNGETGSYKHCCPKCGKNMGCGKPYRPEFSKN